MIVISSFNYSQTYINIVTVDREGKVVHYYDLMLCAQQIYNHQLVSDSKILNISELEAEISK